MVTTSLQYRFQGEPGCGVVIHEQDPGERYCVGPGEANTSLLPAIPVLHGCPNASVTENGSV
jgi:hypothetical protein